MAPGRPPKTEQPIELPRGLVFGASIWLAASWLISIGVRPPLQPTSATYTPAVRMMVVSMMIGTLVAWPLARLSNDPPRRPLLAPFLDLVSIAALGQIVVWPLRLVTTWPVERTSLVSFELLASAVLAGGLLALVGVERRGRSLAMAGLLALVVLPPIAAIALDTESLGAWSPLARMWIVAGGGPSPIETPAWIHPSIVAGAGGLLWVVSHRRLRRELTILPESR